MPDKQTHVVKLPVSGQEVDSVRLMLEDNIQMWREKGWHYAGSTTLKGYHSGIKAECDFVFLSFCK